MLTTVYLLTPNAPHRTAQQDAALDVDGRMHESKHVSRGEASGGPATQNSRLQGLTDATQACEWDSRKRPCQDSRVEADEQAATATLDSPGRERPVPLVGR